MLIFRKTAALLNRGGEDLPCRLSLRTDVDIELAPNALCGAPTDSLLHPLCPAHAFFRPFRRIELIGMTL